MRENETVGSRIRALRKQFKLTQAELAKIVDVSAPNVTAWEKDSYLPKTEPLALMSKYFGVTQDYILYGTGEHTYSLHPTTVRLYQAVNLPPEQISTDLNTSLEIIKKWETDGIPKHDALKAALKYKISLDWILSGIGTKDISSNGLFKTEDQEKVPVARGRWVPVKAYSKMGMDGYFMDMYGEGSGGDGYIPSLSAGPRAYAVKGTGDSMFPAIRNGWYVVCDPDAPPTPTEFVQVCLKDGRCTIKEFIGLNNGVLSLISVNGGERLSFDMDEVESMAAITDIVPPSRHRQEYPLMPVKDLKIEND